MAKSPLMHRVQGHGHHVETNVWPEQMAFTHHHSACRPCRLASCPFANPARLFPSAGFSPLPCRRWPIFTSLVQGTSYPVRGKGWPAPAPFSGAPAVLSCPAHVCATTVIAYWPRVSNLHRRLLAPKTPLPPSPCALPELAIFAVCVAARPVHR